MPYRQRGFFRPRRQFLRPVNSNKNIVTAFTASTAGTKTTIVVANAVDSAALATTNQVERGSAIKAIWLELWIWATEEIAVGVTTGIDAYIIKNPGTNFTNPIPGTVGSSNEKKFVFKSWKGLIGPKTQGFPAYFWKGWIKVPKGMQRQGANDRFDFVFQSTGTNVLVCHNFIYKWFK